MAYAFISYSEADDIDGEIKEFVGKLFRRVRQEFGEEPKYVLGRNRDPGPLDEALKQKIDGASVFIPIFSDNYARQKSTAWAEMIYAESLVDRKPRPVHPKEFIKPVLYRYPKLALSDWLSLHDRSYDCFSLTESWRPGRWLEPDFEGELARLAILLGKGLFGDAPSPQEPLPGGKTKSDVLRVVQELHDLIDNSGSDNVFSNELKFNIIEEVKNEIQSASKDDYLQDLSLGRSFIVRAKAIFRPARSVIAVSLDSSSDFWTGHNTRDLALDYTELQPKNTLRLFVFSSPQSMLLHRWVLAEHHKQYGRGEGKVLFTSLTRWQAYLNRGEIKTLPDVPSLTEDFGILHYAGPSPMEERHVVARLSTSELSFKSSPGSKFMSAFSNDLRSEAVERPHPDGETFAIEVDGQPAFWRWRDAYMTMGDDKAWLRCVADVFDGDIDFGPSYKAAVMHNVYFNPTPERGPGVETANEYAKFEIFIKKVIFDLLRITSGKEQLIKSIWFGRYVNESDVAFNDPIHQNRIVLDPSIWKYCLSMTFKDQDDLKEFYEHPEHAEIRKRVYTFLDPSVGPLYATLKKSANAGIGAAIERIIRKYLLRMDYVTPDPYFIYRAVAAPDFAKL